MRQFTALFRRHRLFFPQLHPARHTSGQRRLSLFLVLLLSAALFAPAASARNAGSVAPELLSAGQSALPRWSGEVTLNRSALYPRSIRFDGNRVTFSGIPDEESSLFLMLVLTNAAGEEAFKAVTERAADFTAFFELGGVSPGLYTLNLYHNSQRYQSYSHVLGLTVELSNGVWAVVGSPVYARNAALSGEESVGEAAQAFYLHASPDIQVEEPRIQALAAQITSGLSLAYEKALAVHDWVCANIYYDYDVFYSRADFGDTSALGTLVSRRSVCEGYANLTTALLRASGVPAKKVNGYALGISGGNTFPEEILLGTGESNHAWVEAFADGRWILMDPTWDSGNDYAFGRISVSGGCESHRYFDASQELFSMDHAALENPRFGQIMVYLNYGQMWTVTGWKSYTNNDVKAFRKDGWVMVPIGSLIEEMGGSSSWNRVPGFLDRLTIRAGGHHVQLWPGWKEFYVDGTRFLFDVAPVVVEGYTEVQIAPLFEALGFTASYDGVQDNWQDGRVSLTFAA